MRLSVIKNAEAVGRVEIDRTRTLGRGATAEIYAVEFDGRACAAKIYLDPSTFNEAKILAMLGNPPGSVQTNLHGRDYPLLAWPEAILSDGGRAVGFLMPAIDPNHAFPLDFYFDRTLFNRLGSPAEAALSYRLEIAANLCSLVAGLHAQGHHFIDIKPQNIRVLRGIHVVTLVDCDGFSICSLSGTRYPAELMSTDYVAPEAFRSHASPATLGEQQDRYALAVILFQLLNGGTHPFQGILGNPNAQAATNDEKAAAGLYPHGLSYSPFIEPRPSSTHVCWPESTRGLFDRAFVGAEESRPSAADWADHFNELLSTKALIRCDVRPNDLGHMRFKDKPCAGCLQDAALASPTSPLPAFKKGAVSGSSPQQSTPTGSQAPVAGGAVGGLMWFLAALTFLAMLVYIVYMIDSKAQRSRPSAELNVEARPVAEMAPSMDDKALVQRGYAYAVKQDYANAIADYTAAIQINPRNGDTFVGRGDIHLALRDYTRALSDYSQAIQINPRNDGAFVARGDTYWAIPDHDSAIADYTAAIKINPGNGDAFVRRGYAYGSRQDYVRAIADYTEAIKINPRNGDAFVGRGYAYGSRQDYVRGIADLTAAIKINPGNEDAFYWRYAVYLEQKDFSRAVADADRAGELDPTNAGYQNSRCWSRAVANRELEIARAACDAALSIAPGDADTLDSRGLVGLRQERYQDAWNDYDAAATKDPSIAGSVFGRGVAALRLGQLRPGGGGSAAEARAEFEAAKRLDPKIEETFAGYGIIP